MDLRRLFIKDRKLGVAEGRRYDLPLHKSEGTGFLILLIGLMSFLAVLALLAFFSLGNISERWSSGLENKLTLEIPAENPDGGFYSVDEMSEKTGKIEEILKDNSGIESYEILDHAAIGELVSPWLGENFISANPDSNSVPLPGLISIELINNSNIDLQAFEKEIKNQVPETLIDGHEEWLSTLLTITSTLQFSAFFVLIIIGFITFTAVAGAIRARIAVHKKDVELLHLMGAKDSYITRQFQRHAFMICLQGAVSGTLASAFILWVTGFFIQSDSPLFPELSLALSDYVLFVLLPVILASIGAITARMTVLRSLAEMP